MMQEVQYSDKLVREFFVGKTDEEIAMKMHKALREHETKGATLVRQVKIGRNAKCPCGSDLKFKKCCLHKAS